MAVAEEEEEVAVAAAVVDVVKGFPNGDDNNTTMADRETEALLSSLLCLLL